MLESWDILQAGKPFVRAKKTRTQPFCFTDSSASVSALACGGVKPSGLRPVCKRQLRGFRAKQARLSFPLGALCAVPSSSHGGNTETAGGVHTYIYIRPAKKMFGVG